MSTVILTQAEVRELLPMRECLELVRGALAAYSRGAALNPLRRGVRLQDGERLLGLMPGYLAEPEALGLKVVTVFPANHASPWDVHQGLVCLFDLADGRPTAILDASEITALRTAAASGVATQLLAREDAAELALLGAGVQARTHLEAMLLVRSFRRVRVFSPRRESRESFARHAAERHGLDVLPAASARAAVEGADVVCTVTSAHEPVLKGAWLSPGVHVNAVGACLPKARELDAEAVRRARVFVDSRESAAHEAGDLLLARAEGAIGADHVAGELGELVEGRVAGRRAPDEITLFKSLGLAVEDLAVAQHVLARARERGLGARVELGGRR